MGEIGERYGNSGVRHMGEMGGWAKHKYLGALHATSAHRLEVDAARRDELLLVGRLKKKTPVSVSPSMWHRHFCHMSTVSFNQRVDSMEV